MKKIKERKSETDWERVRNMKDEDIDFSDLPPITDEMFERGFVYKGTEAITTSRQTAVLIFNDVVAFFKKRQIPYTFEIDRVLRDYIATEQAKSVEADR